MAPAHQVLYTHGGGRLGNQVLRFAHWIAWVLEQGDGQVEVRDFAFWPYARYFAWWRNHPGCVFPPRSDAWDEIARWRDLLPEYVTHRLDWRLQRFLQVRGGRWPGWQAIDADSPGGKSSMRLDEAFWRRVQRKPVTACAGWNLAGWDLVARHQSRLRDYFQPERATADRARTWVDDLRRRHGRVIGLFMRQEDYRVWQDGRFYFSLPCYVRWAQEAVELYADDNPAVVIAAAEWSGGGAFGRLPVYPSTGNPGCGGHWFDQWAQLAECDMVLSVPSTFAATAAFRGAKPLWPLLRADQRLARDQLLADALLDASRHSEFRLAVN